MVDIAPFHALRYSSVKKSTDISTSICPPYDVVSPEERAALAKRSAQNIIQLELPEGEGAAKYDAASTLLKKWQAENVLQTDRGASFYVIETTYKITDAFAPKSQLKRYGVLVALQLETPGRGRVRPHEKTLPKAKEDRLYLLRAVETNISPIFGLFFDKKKIWAKWIAQAIKGRPLVQGREKKDLMHRLWKIDNPKLQKQLVDLLKSKELYIADGHHRYEVAWAYKEERLQKNPEASRTEGWNSVMAYICPMEEKGLLMLPTHRLVTSTWRMRDWKEHVEKFFTIKPVKNMAAIVSALAKPKRSSRILGWVTGEGSYLLTLRSDISVDRCMSERPDVLKELDVVLLHDLILSQVPNMELVYTRDLKEIAAQVKNPAKTAFLLASAGVESLARVSSAGEVMPPKTTYFYPKVPTGFTLMPLNQKI